MICALLLLDALPSPQNHNVKAQEFLFPLHSPWSQARMDGISVAASILGLVGAAAKITLYLNALVTSVKTAPKLAQSVLLEVSDVSVCLGQLQQLLLRMEMGSGSQERLIIIEQLVVVLSNCVSIFSELEEILESLDVTASTPMSKVKIARWLQRQQSISALLIRLQASKQSLTLVVTTLNW